MELFNLVAMGIFYLVTRDLNVLLKINFLYCPNLIFFFQLRANLALECLAYSVDKNQVAILKN